MQIALNLDSEARRPVVQISWFHGCRAMLDTGALFPIWVASDELLMGLGARLSVDLEEMHLAICIE